MKYLVQLSRILVGVLFIISGLIKSNDTVGFAYKLEEYYQVFGTEFLISTAVFQAMLICIMEVMLGVALLLGTRINLTLWLLMLMIVFFTFLTFYSAYYNKVTDCGCFGDAIKLTPWESFTKDVVLLVLILILVIGRKYIRPVFNPKLTNAVLVTALFANVLFPVYTYAYLPVIDFRPYAPGKDILEGMQGGTDGVYETSFLYKNLNTGEIKEFSGADYPWQDTLNWAWDSTITRELVAPVQPPIHDFSISNVDGYDYTEDILNYEGYQFFLVSYDLARANRSVQEKVNEFAGKCEQNQVPFYGLTAATPSLIDEFRHEVQAPYEYYISDATQLKTMIRSNPGLILLKGAKVVAMWPHRAFPSYESVKKEYFK